MGRFSSAFNEQLAAKHPDYSRYQYQSFLTAPEWRNVEMAQEMAAFLKAGQPIYRYPYFSQIFTLWKVFFHSIKAANKHNSLKDIIFSEYTLMNMFICCFTTVGFLAKGCLSLVLWPIFKKANHTPFQAHVAKLVEEYASFIHKTPFFNYPYSSALKTLWHNFRASPNKSLADYITFMVASIELITRTIIAAPIAYWYNQPQNQEADRLSFLIKTREHPAILFKNNNIIIVECISKQINGNTSFYAHVTVPRYEGFLPSIQDLLKQAKIIKIAGCDNIQCKLGSNDPDVPKQQQVLYQYQNSISQNSTTMLDVKVKDLKDTLQECKKQNLTVKYLHDF